LFDDDDAAALNGQTPGTRAKAISSELPVAKETNYHARSLSRGLQIRVVRHRGGIGTAS